MFILNILIAYYSLTGNTEYLAKNIKESIDADILEIKPRNPLKPKGLVKIIKGVIQVLLKKEPKLKSFDLDPSDYDLIFLGTPVWVSRFSAPLRSFLSKIDLSGKNVALLMCYAKDAKKAMKRLKEFLSDAEIRGEIAFEEPTEEGSEAAKEKAISWAKHIISSLE